MRSQKGKISSWLIFIIMIVIVFAAIYFLQKYRKAPSVVEAPPAEVIEEVKEEEVKEKRRKPKGFAIPEIPEEEKQEIDKEAYRQAILSGEGCESILYDKELKQLCIDSMLYDSALQDNNEALCKKISDQALQVKCLNNVYYNLATKNFDTDLCNKITDDKLKQQCLDSIQGLMGRTAESAEDCESIQDDFIKQQCLDNFYLASSVKKLDEDSCENIKDLDLKERCTKTVAKNIEVKELSKQYKERTYITTEKKLEGCDALEGDLAKSCKDDANYDLALEKRDLSYCNAIGDTERQGQCVSMQSANINSYYFKQATLRNDASLCNKILDPGLKSTCLDSIQ